MPPVRKKNTFSMPVCAASGAVPRAPTISVIATNCDCSTTPANADGKLCARKWARRGRERHCQVQRCQHFSWRRRTRQMYQNVTRARRILVVAVAIGEPTNPRPPQLPPTGRVPWTSKTLAPRGMATSSIQ